MLVSSLTIENFRGIKELQLDLSKETVIIGENNSGKTSVLEAFRYCLERIKSKKSFNFDEYDFHFDSSTSDPSGSEKIKIIIEFSEQKPDEWSDELVRSLDGITSFDSEDRQSIKLEISAWHDSSTGEFQQDWNFLDEKNNPMTGKASNPNALTNFQRIRPIFYLSALRDAGKEFSRNSQFWKPFLKSNEFSPELREEIELSLNELNTKVVESHESFDEVKTHLSKLQQLITLGNGSTVSIEALPSRIFDLLSKTQIHIQSTNGAKLPIVKHGEGTQSLSVLLLFDAFLKAKLITSFDKNSSPVIALEEPEAHLHPCAIRCLWNTIQSLDGQKIISTHSGELLSEVPIKSVRRLYRKNGNILVGSLKSDTLSPDDAFKFDYHIRRTRGELLFANTWILVEGPTEVCLLSEFARLLGFDIERWGVRIVDYRQANIEVYLKVARDFGIEWCAFIDGDQQQGAPDKNKAEEYSDGSVDRIVQITHDNIETYLCMNGFGSVYEKYLTENLKPRVNGERETIDYWTSLIKTIKSNRNFSKPVAALEVVEKARLDHEKRPKEFKDIIVKSIELAGGKV